MELGSEYNLSIANSQAEDNVFSYLSKFKTVFTDSGRSALRILINELSPKQVLMPDYMCESVIECFSDTNIIYYRINEDMSIDIRDFELQLQRNEKIDCVYLMHYFGSTQRESIIDKLIQLKKIWRFTIIEDTTHSFLTCPKTIGDFCICSLRKWFSIPDGGVLYSDIEFPDIKLDNCDYHRVSKKVFAMFLKSLYLNNIEDCNLEYRQIFADCEEELDAGDRNRALSTLSRGILKTISISEEINIRKRNRDFILNNMRNRINPVIQGKNYAPLTLPIYIENRDDMRSYLIDHKIFCAVHWPIKDERLGEAQKISKKILSLPIDARYCEAEMQYLIDVISKHEDNK